MLVNDSRKGTNKDKHVKFVSYTGEYPTLCSGILTLEIDGEEHIFGSFYPARTKPEGAHNKFWMPGGGVHVIGDYDGFDVQYGAWGIDVEKLPEQFRKYAEEIDEVFNANVERACCGGCI